LLVRSERERNRIWGRSPMTFEGPTARGAQQAKITCRLFVVLYYSRLSV
jgi:hypothetical protein